MAARLALPLEDTAAFEAYRDALIKDTRPEGAIENELFDRLLLHGWSLLRIRASEARLVADSGAGASDPAVVRRLVFLSRYRRDLERAYDRALKELSRRQTERAILLQQEEEAISKLYRVAPLAALSVVIRHTDPFFRATQPVARDADLAPSRDHAHAAYLRRHTQTRDAAKAA